MLNFAFQPLLISWILDWSAVGLLSSILPLWVQYVLVKPTGSNPDEYEKASLYLGYCACATFLSAMLAMPLWLWLGRKMGKRFGWLAYNVANSITCPWFFLLGEGDIVGAVLIAALNGAAFGGQFFVDSVTAGRYTVGRNRCVYIHVYTARVPVCLRACGHVGMYVAAQWCVR